MVSQLNAIHLTFNPDSVPVSFSLSELFGKMETRKKRVRDPIA